MFWYFFLVNASWYLMTCFHEGICAKLVCAYSPLLLYTICCFPPPQKNTRESLCKWGIFCIKQSLRSLSFVSCNSFFLSQFGCCCQLPTEHKALQKRNCILYVLTTYFMKLWKIMLGIQLSSFPTFLYLIIYMLVMKAFRIMHLRGRWNSVMQQTSESRVAEVSSKGRLALYDACFMSHDKWVACFVTAF